jgi:hypothetical protein
VTDAQILAAIKKLTPRERAALAVQLQVSERTIHRWKVGESGIAKMHPLVREALEKALAGRSK